METSEKMKALEAARLQIEKQFGQGAIMKLGDKANVAEWLKRQDKDLKVVAFQRFTLVSE